MPDNEQLQLFEDQPIRTALNMLAEAATTEISREQKPTGFAQSRDVARAGGAAAKAARDSVEASTGRPVITAKNAAQLNHMVTAMIEASAAIEGTEKTPPAPAEEAPED